MTTGVRGIQLHEVQVRYGAMHALQQCSLHFTAGEPCLLLGGNGAGKTTLLRTLAACMRPSRGTVEYVPGKVDSGAISYLGSDLYLYDSFTVEEMVQLYHRLAVSPSKSYGDQLSRWKLENHSKQQVATLSRGQQMRLALACCTLRDPCFQFFDEPTSVLDDASVSIFASYVQERSDALTVIASHDIERLLPHVKRLVLLHQGAILADARVGSEECDQLIRRYRETNR